MKYEVFIRLIRKIFSIVPESTHKNQAKNSEQLEFTWNRKKRAVFKGGIDISAGPFKEQRSSCPIKTMLPFAYSMLIKISLNGFEKIRKPIFKNSTLRRSSAHALDGDFSRALMLSSDKDADRAGFFFIFKVTNSLWPNDISLVYTQRLIASRAIMLKAGLTQNNIDIHMNRF